MDVYAELVAALAASAIMLRSIDRRGWDAIDLTRAFGAPTSLLIGWCAGGLPIAVAVAAMLATGLLRFVPSTADATWLGAAFRTTLVLLPAALAEELICRGYLLTVVRDSVGTRIAVVGTSVMFGLLHLANPGATVVSFPSSCSPGVLLATVRLALNSLYAAWMAHFAWNWVMAVPFHAGVSGDRVRVAALQGGDVGPAWLSGGEWGPEGGLVAALSMIAGLAYFYTRRRRGES